MRVKSSVLFGLIALLCVISGVSVYKQLREVHDSWQPSDMYTGLKGMRSRTYSSVSYGNAASSDDAVLSLGARSMSSHNAAFSYAHAPVSPAISMGSTSSYGQSAVAGGNPVYATSNAEVRSFGGGGNGGGSVSMSGGVAKSTGSRGGSFVSVGVSSPSTPVLAVNSNRNSNISVLPNISGEVVANPVATYAGIGNTTGGASRGLGGRKNLGIEEGNVEDSWLNWLALMGTEYGHQENGVWVYDIYELRSAYDAFCASWNFGMGKKPTWDEWLAWFMGSEGSPYMWDDGDNQYGFSYVPIGDFMPLIVFAFLYVVFMVYRRRQCKMINSSEDVE